MELVARNGDHMNWRVCRLLLVASVLSGCGGGRSRRRPVEHSACAGEQAIRDSGLEWTIVYPAGLTNGPRTGTARVGERIPLSGFPTVSRADVAAVLLRQLNDIAFVRKGILVAQ